MLWMHTRLIVSLIRVDCCHVLGFGARKGLVGMFVPARVAIVQDARAVHAQNGPFLRSGEQYDFSVHHSVR